MKKKKSCEADHQNTKHFLCYTTTSNRHDDDDDVGIFYTTEKENCYILELQKRRLCDAAFYSFDVIILPHTTTHSSYLE